jgi:AcrR family transcriptional regulator
LRIHSFVTILILNQHVGSGLMVNRKASIFNTAVRLFAAQGYEATTTLQIAKEVGVTEPAVFYHFQSKNAFFSTVLEAAAKTYLERIDALALDGQTAFESLGERIRIHFAVVAEEPEFMRILLRTCPARLENPESTCSKIYREAKSKLQTILRSILKNGIESGEFVQVDVAATSDLLIAMFNGLMRQQIAGMDGLDAVERGTVAFCRNALLKKGGIKN